MLITDAPCHGEKYHNCGWDNHGAGDPNGLIVEDQIKSFAEKRINFSAIKINEVTDKMYTILNKSYHKEMGTPI